MYVFHTINLNDDLFEHFFQIRNSFLVKSVSGRPGRWSRAHQLLNGRLCRNFSDLPTGWTANPTAWPSTPMIASVQFQLPTSNGAMLTATNFCLSSVILRSFPTSSCTLLTTILSVALTSVWFWFFQVFQTMNLQFNLQFLSSFFHFNWRTSWFRWEHDGVTQIKDFRFLL